MRGESDMETASDERREIDVRFADFLCGLADDVSEELHRTACEASAALGNGDICLDLAECWGDDFPRVAAKITCSGVVGSPGENTPLVLDDRGRLYLYRYWRYEQCLAERLLSMSAERWPVEISLFSDGLDRLFGSPGDGIDWQRVAAAAAVRVGLCVISGGPGTGKTTTVVKIIALMIEQAGSGTLRIGLAAPTGKAAARLGQAIRSSRERLAGMSPAVQSIPDDVYTLHRLLGVIPGSCRFRHNRDNTLPFDVVVIDEASMVPLPLMAKLVDALAPGARLLLLGDRDQLASVEAGSVLGDICDTGKVHRYSREFYDFLGTFPGMPRADDEFREESPLADSLVMLQRNYRFSEGSAIGAVSQAINAGLPDDALEIARADNSPALSLRTTPPPETLARELGPLIVAGYGDYLRSKDPETVLDLFDQFRVLCALRHGSYGVENLNGVIEQILASAGLIRPDRCWYAGRPVMVTANDYSLRLFNGDVGIALPDPELNGKLSVCFPSPAGGIRRVSPMRLPEHETVYAMTIHKSQGSEFGRVLMILPASDTPLLTRELIYTGITRARIGVELWCVDEVFRDAVVHRIRRRSGLNDALWKLQG